jgi:type 1 fimbriae regulatory protein FimB
MHVHIDGATAKVGRIGAHVLEPCPRLASRATRLLPNTPRPFVLEKLTGRGGHLFLAHPRIIPQLRTGDARRSTLWELYHQIQIPRNLGRRCDSGSHELYNGESAAVKAWLAEREKMNPPADCDTLFISERRKPLSRCTVWVMIGRLAAAGLEHLDIHPHMLRHSCGYALINKGTDVRTIQAYLGHRSISSTVRYTNLDRKRFVKLF